MTWRSLWLYSGVFALIGLAYQILEAEPSRPAALLLSYGTPVAVAVWIDGDARHRRRSPCWEFGAFVVFAWPIAVPAYCFWSRGRRGWRLLGALLTVIVGPAVLGTLIYAVYRGVAG
jgi:hypothetical protein